MNFAILAPPRSGTNMLVKMLDQHPEICCHGEIYHPLVSVRSRHRSPHEGRRVTGFKIVFDHLDRCGLWETAAAAERFVTIRRNPLVSLVSYRQAVACGNWSHSTEPPPLVAISATELFLWNDMIERCYERVQALGPCLEVQYRDLEASIPQVCEFLGVEPLPLRPATVRLTPRPLRDRVKALDSLREETPDSLRWVFDAIDDERE